MELGAQWQQNGFLLGLNASYNHAQDDVTKQDLLRRPRRSVSLTTGYQQQKWGISTEILAKSRALDAPLFGSTVARRLAGYTVANVNGYVEVVANTKIRLSVENITDKSYSFAYAGATTRYLATPFTTTLSADIKF